jgi:hypothetical protein
MLVSGSETMKALLGDHRVEENLADPDACWAPL